ncbi:diguanylate cyclase domain-containing protein [Vibrio ziniensis]|uniref:Sensor domain-containing diguanylate cyclase n=1 Tax=Vibrio ziniensis TaxID=2711221 RepID=A0A6G7CHZ0_9VIBR|nr:diguanylate cyclase [Vibrio ziniensis]QIH41694.1 sensor domain-containing diguanylate cyclase [Vibrio ziniensis]
MSYNKKTNFIFIVLSIVYFAIAAPITMAIKNHYVSLESKKVEMVVANNISLVRSNFEASIFMDTFLADSLATLITIDPDVAFKNWEVVASQLLKKSQHVRNVTASPNNVITYIYPLKGNEAAIGIDLSRVPEQNKAIQLAKQNQHVYIDGPVNLVQGGRGLIARYPIYSDFPYNKAYWGTVSVVIDYDALMKSSGIYDIFDAEIAIRNITNTAKMLYGEAELFDKPDIQQFINLPFGRWQLAAKYKLTDSSHLLFIQRAILTTAFFAILLIYALFFLVYKNYKIIHMAAMQDELTQLPNRRYINELLRKMSSKRDNNAFFTLLSIDVNDFKYVNDNFGHDVGDRFLQFISIKLKENIRSTDTVARIGGDEFLIILQNVYQPEKVTNVIQSIKGKIESESFFHKNKEIKPSLSIGYAIYNDKNTDIEALITKADHAMYLNKNANAFIKNSYR